MTSNNPMGRPHCLNEIQRARVCRRYTAGESSLKLARFYEVSPSTILNTLRAAGTPIRGDGKPGRPARFNSVQRREIVKRYLAGESTTKLGKEYGISSRSIGHILELAGVGRRNRTEAAVLRWRAR